jgi:catechol 2,3-dioxygenase-like lactoylglutathione lyase family enzyme
VVVGLAVALADGLGGAEVGGLLESFAGVGSAAGVDVHAVVSTSPAIASQARALTAATSSILGRTAGWGTPELLPLHLPGRRFHTMAATADTVHWRGVHHLALVTPDMDATVRFWHGVIDARLIATIGTPTFRHYFFEVGAGNSVAFFEYTGQHLDSYSKPAGVPYEKAPQFDHLSINLPDEDALLRLRDRLKSHGCEVTDVVDHGFLRSIYFSDNNGIALEASWWTLDPTGRPVDYGDERLFSDADPVPSVRELREQGELDHTVETHLVDKIVEDLAAGR